MRLRHSVVIANGSRRAVLSSSSAARLPSTSSIALSNATSNNPSNNYNFECGIQPLKRWESTSSNMDVSFYSSRDKYYWMNDDNVRSFLRFVVERFRIEKPDDWYSITPSRIAECGGDNLLVMRGSLTALLLKMFPEYDLLPWKFEVVPKGFWSKVEYQKWYLRWLGEKLGIREGNPQDWYKRTNRALLSNYGGRLLSIYDNSLFKLLSTMYPDKEWLPWGFSQVPRGFWEKIENQQRYIQWLGKRLGYKSPEDWYRIQSTDLTLNFGAGLLSNHYNNSPIALLKAVFPNYNFRPWLFNQVPFAYWKDIRNQIEFLKWIAETESLSQLEDLRPTHIKSHGGDALLKLYDHSMVDMLKTINAFLESNGISLVTNAVEPKLSYRPMNYWSQLGNQKEFMSELAKKLGFEVNDYERWYSISVKDFRENNGIRLLTVYQGSIYHVLQAVFPEHEWLPWKFSVIPKVAVYDPIVMKKVIAYVEKELSLKSRDEWKRVTQLRLRELGVYHFFHVRGGIVPTIDKAYIAAE